MGSHNSPRCKWLVRKTGKSHRWCREFLEDFGRFNEVVARALGKDVRHVDRGLALWLERARIEDENRRQNVELSEVEVDRLFVDGPMEPSELTDEEVRRLFGG